MAIELTDETFQDEVIKSEKNVLVDFYTEWCGPCKMMAPIIEELSVSHADTIKVAKINIDKYPLSADAYDVKSIPTFILFKDGKAAETILGAVHKDRLIKIIEENNNPSPKPD